MNMRQKRELNLMNRVIPVKKTIKDLYNYTGMKFINSREFKDWEEEFIEEMSEFYANILENIEDIERKINEENNSSDSLDSLARVMGCSTNN